MSTNKIGDTNVYGTFNNLNYNSILKPNIAASANFDGDLTVKKNVSVKTNLTLGNETSTVVDGITTYTDTGGDIMVNLNGITYTITPTLLIQLITLSTTYQIAGSYLISSDLSTYLTSVLASTTYQLKGPYLLSSDLSPYLTSDLASTTYQLKGTTVTKHNAVFTGTTTIDILNATTIQVAGANIDTIYQPIGNYAPKANAVLTGSTSVSSLTAYNIIVSNVLQFKTTFNNGLSNLNVFNWLSDGNTYFDMNGNSNIFFRNGNSALSTVAFGQTNLVNITCNNNITAVGTITGGTINGTTLQVGGADLNTLFQAKGTYAPLASPAFTGTTTMVNLTTTGNIICNYLNFDTLNGGACYIKSTNQDGASASAHQLQIGSWYGIGFKDLCNSVTNIFFDLRTGTINTLDVNASCIRISKPSGSSLYFTSGNNYITVNPANNILAYNGIGGHLFYYNQTEYLTIYSEQITFKKPTAFTVNCPTTTLAPSVGSHLCNKDYVDSKLSSGINQGF